MSSLELRNLGARDIERSDEADLSSTGPQVFGTAMRSVAPELGDAVFLHTGWRSGGTWIWSQCRAIPHVCGFYEPLHEQAARFRRRDVATMRPGSWQSNHSDTPPYFEEYRELIDRNGRGVARYDSRFAFDTFFRSPDEPSDPDLETYLDTLLAGPRARGKLPVLKFCRSMGRVGWLENLFPQALHLVVLRDPLAQFHSIQRLLLQQRNRYFALAPLLVLARNAGHPAVREAAQRLGVTLPALHSVDMDYAVETCWRHIRRASAAEHYRGFLAFWTLCAVTALQSEAQVIDMDAIGSDAAHRLSIEAALGSHIGGAIRLEPRQQEPVWRNAALPDGMSEAHSVALRLVRDSAGGLTAGRRALIASKLEAGLDLRATGHGVAGWSSPALPGPAGNRSILQRLATGAMVLIAKALQPLRRLHGAMVWRRLATK
jgi:hypothetical protein